VHTLCEQQWLRVVLTAVLLYTNVYMNRFNNAYFVLLKNLNWTPRKWEGPFQYADASGSLMMLPRYGCTAYTYLIWSSRMRNRTYTFLSEL
jgi:hypothetical protein